MIEAPCCWRALHKKLVLGRDVSLSFGCEMFFIMVMVLGVAFRNPKLALWVRLDLSCSEPLRPYYCHHNLK